jgi:hypothetical protein
VFVLPNVTVGEYSTIGAGSVINKSIPAYSLAAGSPAKVIKAEGEHLKKYSIEEKSAIIETIFKDFIDYQNYKRPRTYQLEKKPFGFSIIDNNKNSSIDYFFEGKPSSTSGIVVSLQVLNAQERLTISRHSWFDLDSKEAFILPSDAGNELKDFFSRYGIRFERLDHNP